MKIKHVFTTLGLAIAAIGIGAGLNAKGVVREAKADGEVTFYFDYTAGSWWGNSSAVTKLEDNNGIRYEAELAYTGSSVYKVTINTSSLTSVKFVRLDPENLNGDAWNSSSDVTNFANNYCNLYDNGYGNNSYNWEAAKTNYVLDMSGNLLKTTHNAHIWTQGSSDAAATKWPGRAMNQVGSSRFYEVTFKGSFTNIIFTNKTTGTGQTGDLTTGADGKVWCLQSDWNGAWVSYSAATFIDTYLKFDSIDVGDTTKGTACKDGWSDLYTAYTTTYASVQSEIISVPQAKARLAAWAEANNATLNESTGALTTTSIVDFSTNKDSNFTLVITIITAMTLISFAGMFLLKRKQDK